MFVCHLVLVRLVYQSFVPGKRLQLCRRDTEPKHKVLGHKKSKHNLKHSVELKETESSDGSSWVNQHNITTSLTEHVFVFIVDIKILNT